jgi:hypothetical protein
MVFGTTYCAISHLPIEDGDKCILIPLGFNMKYEFDQFNGADVNSFMYLYSFIYEPQEVIYNGNPDDITYLDKIYESGLKHQLYMLVHHEFYHSIQREYRKNSECFESVERLPLFKTCETIWKKAQEIKKEKQMEWIIKSKERKLTESEMVAFMATPYPVWMRSVYKIAMFMDEMGMQPYPNNTVDQHGCNELYEKLRSHCINLKKPKIEVSIDDKTNLTFDNDSGDLIGSKPKKSK